MQGGKFVVFYNHEGGSVGKRVRRVLVLVQIESPGEGRGTGKSRCSFIWPR